MAAMTYDGVGYGCEIDNECLNKAIPQKNTKLVQWLLDQGCEWNFQSVRIFIELDDVEYLQWAYSKGLPCMVPMGFYAKSNFEMIRWVYENGCQWSSLNGSDIPFLMNQSFETYKWVVEHGCPVSAETLNIAHELGMSEVCDWLVSNGYVDPNA
jgi:hypothetical protein